MEIRQLTTFIAIVELGGFTKAAEQMGYAQSTVTSHIQLLEAELGKPLFDRLGKKLVLTAAGRDLLPRARQMLAIHREIMNIAADEGEVSGDLVLGAGESLSIYRLGETLKEFKKSCPRVNIILKNSICTDLRSKLHTGELDISLTIEPSIEDPDLIVRSLKREPMVFIGSPEADMDFLALGSSVPMASDSIIFSEKGCSFRIAFESYLRQRSIRHMNPLEFSSIEASKKCVMNGLGISLLPRYAVSSELKEGTLKALEAPEQLGIFATQLAYHKNKSISQPMSKFMEIAARNSASWK